ncbi:hypothetical protein RJ639_041102 [Escallonia herrerae]|uniref:RRM domain-containing protein n=1 Tax=Escallonia herrerae TaxID=1293975 RepID=A0AA88WG93_9ASTE|nr:hypothetical protein RJ639_041102 [Escallonia herrerae]
MAAGVEMTGEAAMAAPSLPAAAVVQSSTNNTVTTGGNNTETNAVAGSGPKEPDSKPEFQMQDMLEMLSKLKLNPLAKEFFPSSYSLDRNRGDQFAMSYFVQANKDSGNDGYPNNRRRRNNYNQGRRRLNGKAFRAQREDSIRRTVYVSDIDHNVVDCRVCGDPHSRLRFAFVEFADEHSSRAALSLCGTMLGFSPVRVLPSKTAILPVNPTFLPRSEDEREMCARTVYCTNIDKKVSQADVKNFFETRCGEVSRLRLLGDHVHSTRIAFVEFAESAIVALDCCGQLLGSQPIRVSPSKTPVRPRIPRPGLQ